MTSNCSIVDRVAKGEIKGLRAFLMAHIERFEAEVNHYKDQMKKHKDSIEEAYNSIIHINSIEPEKLVLEVEAQLLKSKADWERDIEQCRAEEEALSPLYEELSSYDIPSNGHSSFVDRIKESVSISYNSVSNTNCIRKQLSLVEEKLDNLVYDKIVIDKMDIFLTDVDCYTKWYKKAYNSKVEAEKYLDAVVRSLPNE